MTLRKTLEVIADLQRAGVLKTYAIAGAVAATAHVEAVSTIDVDVFVAVSDFGRRPSGLIVTGPIDEALAKRGYTDRRDEGIMVEGWPVRFLPASNPLEAEAMERAELFPVDGAEVRVLGAEYVVAIALNTGRMKDHARIEQFLELKAVDYAALKDVLTRHNLIEKWKVYCFKAGIPDPLPLG